MPSGLKGAVGVRKTDKEIKTTFKHDRVGDGGELVPLDVHFGSGTIIIPRWWHKLVFWKHYDTTPFIFKREYINMKELLRQQSGSPQHIKGKKLAQTPNKTNGKE